MYLAQSISTSQTQAPFYIKMLENIIANHDTNDRDNIDAAIQEAKEIVDGNKDIFAISNRHYFFVTTLLSKYKKNLQELEGNEFDNNTYSGILEVLR